MSVEGKAGSMRGIAWTFWVVVALFSGPSSAVAKDPPLDSSLLHAYWLDSTTVGNQITERLQAILMPLLDDRGSEKNQKEILREIGALSMSYTTKMRWVLLVGQKFEYFHPPLPAKWHYDDWSPFLRTVRQPRGDANRYQASRSMKAIAYRPKRFGAAGITESESEIETPESMWKDFHEPQGITELGEVVRGAPSRINLVRGPKRNYFRSVLIAEPIAKNKVFKKFARTGVTLPLCIFCDVVVEYKYSRSYDYPSRKR